jgi:hypothetical protein
MPTASGMPMPMTGEQGIASGFDMGNKLIQNLMERQKMQQQAQLAQQQAQQQAGQFQQELALRKQAEGRLGSMAPFQQQLLKAQIDKANQEAAWTKMLLGGGEAPSNTSGGMPFSPDMSSQQGQTNQSGQSINPNYSALQSAVESGVMFGGGQLKPGSQDNIQQPIQATNYGSQTIQQGNPNLLAMDKFAGIKGVPPLQTHFDQDGNLVTIHPSGKITRQHISPTAGERKMEEGMASADVDIIKDLQKQLYGGLGAQQTFNSMQEVLDNPEWAKMQDNPVAIAGVPGRKATLEYYRNAGTKEQKDLIARMDTLSGKMVTQMASVFKGPFRVTEQGLIETIKPRPTDTFEAAQAKLQELKKALNIEQYVSHRVSQLMRHQRMDGLDAFDIAKREINAPQFVDSMEEKYNHKNSEGGQFNLNVEAKNLGVSPEDINHTAKLRNITPEQVVKLLKGDH